jgi:hypothetical protein
VLCCWSLPLGLLLLYVLIEVVCSVLLSCQVTLQTTDCRNELRILKLA